LDDKYAGNGDDSDKTIRNGLTDTASCNVLAGAGGAAGTVTAAGTGDAGDAEAVGEAVRTEVFGDVFRDVFCSC